VSTEWRCDLLTLIEIDLMGMLIERQRSITAEKSEWKEEENKRSGSEGAA